MSCTADALPRPCRTDSYRTLGELLAYNMAPPDPLYRLLNAAIEVGSDPALKRLTQEAAYAISALVREALDEVRAEREEEQQ